jgi:hypothetical protein
VALRVVIFGNDGRGSRNVNLSTGTVVASLVVMVAALASVLWLGWKIGELTARL